VPISKPAIVNNASEDRVDEILFANTYNFSVPGGVAGTQTYFEVDTAIAQECLPIGIYTSDGGATYNDLGKLIPNALGSLGSGGFGGAMAPTVSVEARSFADGIVRFVVRREYTIGSVTLTINLALLATAFVSPIENIHTPKLVSKTAFSSSGYYRKMDPTIDSIYSETSITGHPHSVGAVPMVEFWFYDFDAGTTGVPAKSMFYYSKVSTLNDPSNGNADGIKVSASEIVMRRALGTNWITPRLYREP
jgi:hypothetical protein